MQIPQRSYIFALWAVQWPAKHHCNVVPRIQKLCEREAVLQAPGNGRNIARTGTVPARHLFISFEGRPGHDKLWRAVEADIDASDVFA